MERIWTPWRFQYMSEVDKRAGGCVFCEALSRNADEESLILHRGRLNFLILNRFPYTTGHLMIVPYRHIPLLSDASEDELHEMIELAKRCQQALAEAYQPQGYNLGINLGRCAGAGIADHLHMHVLPRWGGDTNFMSVIGETRILPEELHITYRKLKPFFK